MNHERPFWNILPKINKNVSSYLSQNVYEVIVNSRDDPPSCEREIIDENLLFDWNSVDIELNHISDCGEILENSWEWYGHTLKKLWKIMHFAHKKFLLSSNEQKEHVFRLSSWVIDFPEIEDIYNKFKTNGDSELLFCILKLTSYLDRALGDVYSSYCHQVPFLLRDMLSSSLLNELLGNTQVKFLQLLLGSVKGLNLRNVAWHGFFSPCEIHQSIVSTLIIVISSLGVSVKNFERRPTIKCKTLKNYSKCIEPYFLGLYFDEAKFLDVVTNCPFVSNSHRDYWKYAFNLYSQGSYGDSLILLMPLKECILRSIFCYANDCSERILTAEATEFYITLDDILASQIGSEDNRLEQVIGFNMLEMLLDLYVYEDGPRLRDRISHSEIRPYDVPKDITKTVFDISILLLIFITTCKNKVIFESEPYPEYCLQLFEVIKKYEPQFHPTFLFKRSFAGIIAKVILWNKLPMPPVEPQYLNNPAYNMIFNLFRTITGQNAFANYCEELSKKLSDLKPVSIHRPKWEMELISILRKIVSCFEVLDTNIIESCAIKYTLWRKKQMKSRNRENYQRMLGSISNLQLGICCVFHLMYITLKELTCLDAEIKIKRLLRVCQKYAENATTMSSIKKNRWKELLDSTLKLCHVIKIEPFLINK